MEQTIVSLVAFATLALTLVQIGKRFGLVPDDTAASVASWITVGFAALSGAASAFGWNVPALPQIDLSTMTVEQVIAMLYALRFGPALLFEGGRKVGLLQGR